MRNRFLSIMDEESKRMNRLVDDLLTLSRVEIEENNQNFVSISIIPLIQQVIDSLKIKCVQKNIRIKQVTQITDNFINRRVMGISDEIVTVFVNLIENAIKYTPKGGIVRLELLKNNIGSVEISVCDNGLGIPLEDRERVKGRFVRLDKSRTHPGNGLGLSLVDAVANFHSADFTISSIDDNNSKRPGLKAAIIFPKKKIK